MKQKSLSIFYFISAAVILATYVWHLTAYIADAANMSIGAPESGGIGKIYVGLINSVPYILPLIICVISAISALKVNSARSRLLTAATVAAICVCLYMVIAQTLISGVHFENFVNPWFHGRVEYYTVPSGGLFILWFVLLVKAGGRQKSASENAITPAARVFNVIDKSIFILFAVISFYVLAVGAVIMVAYWFDKPGMFLYYVFVLGLPGLVLQAASAVMFVIISKLTRRQIK